MAWHMTADLDEYLAAAGGFLEGRPAQNTVLLTVAAKLRARGAAAYGGAAPLFGWSRSPDGSIDGAFCVTPPFPVLLSTMPSPAAAALAGELARSGRQVSGVTGRAETADAFAGGWQRSTGMRARAEMRERLFRLGELVPPSPPPPGRPRIADAGDHDLLAEWFTEFAREAGTRLGDPADQLSYGGLTLWEDGGTAVAMAGAHRMVAGMVRVGPVYTPPRYRRNGYGAAVTAAASQAARDAGAAEVVLFTDLANPTSNALYQRLGYRPVEDYLVLSFGPAGIGNSDARWVMAGYRGVRARGGCG